MDCLLAEATRGGRVESRHLGAFVVVDADGRTVAAGGDADEPVFPRSAVKAMQALPLLQSGAADRFTLTPTSLALACASHTGTQAHTDVAQATLHAAGLDTPCLECGTHWPSAPSAAHALAATGAQPSALHNNCSGKHAGFLVTAIALGVSPRGYAQPDHLVMRRVLHAVARTTGTNPDPAGAGIDGCAIPTVPIPLRALALGFARLGTGQHLSSEDAAAFARLRAAVAAHPTLLAGEDRFDTVLTAALGTAIFVKGGAEGVHAASLPALGLGIALKVRDGAGRAAEAALAALLLAHLAPTGPSHTLIASLARRTLRNWNGTAVGELRGMPAPART